MQPGDQFSMVKKRCSRNEIPKKIQKRSKGFNLGISNLDLFDVASYQLRCLGSSRRRGDGIRILKTSIHGLLGPVILVENPKDFEKKIARSEADGYDGCIFGF